MRDRSPIEKGLIPYSFDILLGDDPCELLIKYNEAGGFYTVDLYKSGELIVAGEPIVYGVPLFADVYMARKIPCVVIEPLDESGQETAVTQDNFYETVFLTIDDEWSDGNE